MAVLRFLRAPRGRRHRASQAAPRARADRCAGRRRRAARASAGTRARRPSASAQPRLWSPRWWCLERTFTVPFLTPARDTAARTRDTGTHREPSCRARAACVLEAHEHDAARARERGERERARRGGATGRTSAEVSVVILSERSRARRARCWSVMTSKSGGNPGSPRSASSARPRVRAAFRSPSNIGARSTTSEGVTRRREALAWVARATGEGRMELRRAALRCLRRQPAPSAARERRRDVIVYVSGGHPSDVTSAARARRGAPGRARRSSRPRASRVRASLCARARACRATSGDVFSDCGVGSAACRGTDVRPRKRDVLLCAPRGRHRGLRRPRRDRGGLRRELDPRFAARVAEARQRGVRDARGVPAPARVHGHGPHHAQPCAAPSRCIPRRWGT